MMKRGSADDDDKATTRSGTHKRRRQLQPLPARGSPEPPPRSNAIDRVSAWLDCLPESPRSLASSDAVDKPQDKTVFDPPSSLSSNPNKPRSQNYRAQVLRRLEIRVDADADDEARQRLLPPIQDGGLNEERIGEVARELYESARELLERAAVNDEWTVPLSRAIQSLMRDKPDQLCCLPDREWQPALKPVTYIHRIAPSPPSLPQKRSSTTLAADSPHPEPSRNLGYPTPDQTQSPVQSQPATNPPPPLAPPRTPFLHLEPAPARLQPKTPRPDLSVGLSDSDAAWTTDEKPWTRPGLGGRDVKDILVDLQHAAGHEDRMTLITDPCVASPSGLRFPFLIVEATPGANASIADAENNAAVAAACALRILAELSSPERAAAVKKEPASEQKQSAERGAEASSMHMRCFSLTTDGPMHVLWAHTPAGNGSHMVWLGAYRVTHLASARDLVRSLARILHWGAGDLRDWVRHQCVQYIDRILSG
ncbi:hypothetical protein DIS24_g9835 [Lasiodiplodia hormozganensis]|uniref:Uncharacterized protein n=1 Tax=Lasiodiplodia hormozganensis TaxID=869390 RepID=A0AA39XQN8_9PEZI|nr:hypothetical protein DIS24_g9835 [Lasiodiplodia hormozganensis]